LCSTQKRVGKEAWHSLRARGKRRARAARCRWRARRARWWAPRRCRWPRPRSRPRTPASCSAARRAACSRPPGWCARARASPASRSAARCGCCAPMRWRSPCACDAPGSGGGGGAAQGVPRALARALRLLRSGRARQPLHPLAGCQAPPGSPRAPAQPGARGALCCSPRPRPLPPPHVSRVTAHPRLQDFVCARLRSVFLACCARPPVQALCAIRPSSSMVLRQLFRTLCTAG